MNGTTIITKRGIEAGNPEWILVEQSGATIISEREAESLKGNGIDYIAYFLLSTHEKNLADHARN